ncbi:hypothetical protein V6N13_026770 [Hibiscus sabdariffa]
MLNLMQKEPLRCCSSHWYLHDVAIVEPKRDRRLIKEPLVAKGFGLSRVTSLLSETVVRERVAHLCNLVW